VDYDEEPDPFCRDCEGWRRLVATRDGQLKEQAQKLAELERQRDEAVKENERLTAGTLWQQERNLALTKRIAELDASHAGLRNLLREWMGQLQRRPNLKERTQTAIEETKDL
jgi:hypothetical protein